MADNKDIRKYINLLESDKVSKEDTKLLKEDGFSDVETPSTGNETKVEVEFKDGDQVEVEVYAQGIDQLKRLMDLAGIFHKDKQSGVIGGATGPSVPAVPGNDLGPATPEMPGTDMDTGMDTGMDMDTDVSSTPDVNTAPISPEPTGIEADSDVDTDNDTNPEFDFGLDMTGEDLEEEDLEETRYSRWDYGHPNPNLGQEPYEPEASNYSGLAGKKNRYVQAKHGDNAMSDVTKPQKGEDYMEDLEEEVNNSPKKGLKEYMDQISQEKKDLEEVDPKKVGELVARTTPKTLSATQQRAISQITKDLERKAQSGQQDVEELNPEQVMNLVTSDTRAKAAGINDPEEREIEKNINQVGDEFEEDAPPLRPHEVRQGILNRYEEGWSIEDIADEYNMEPIDIEDVINQYGEDLVDEKRQYSFKQSVLPFQGLTGVQRIRRNASRFAKKSLRK